MTYESARKIIGDLACSQGFYGRLARALDEAEPSTIEAFSDAIKDLKDPVDLIMFIEG